MRHDEVIGAKNPRLRHLGRLCSNRRTRRAEQVAVIEGPKIVGEALSAHRAGASRRVQRVFVAQGYAPDLVAAAAGNGIEVITVRPGDLERVLDSVQPQPIAAVVTMATAQVADLPPDQPLLIAVELRDPGNVGTVIRAAEAAGLGGVIIAGASADITSPKVIRAAAGAWLRMPLIEINDPLAVLDLMAERHIPTMAAALDPSAQSLWDSDLRRAAIIVGNEAHGLPADFLARCDHRVIIPHQGPTESLNVAMAASVLAFESLRQRQNQALAPTRPA